MNKIFTLANIKSVVEMIGITAVVFSLFFLWKETEQNRILAEANFDLMIAQNNMLVNQTIVEHPDVWMRGCANDSLSAKEMVIFKAMVISRNDLAYYRVVQSLRLKEKGTSQAAWADFVGFLHDNPGARKVWTEREETLYSYREQLNLQGIVSWYQDITAQLEALDKLEKK